MPSLPSSLALTTIADGTQIVAVDHRNNYTSVQTAINTLITALGGGTAGQYLTATSPSAIAWGAAPAPVSYRKVTQKVVTISVTETDLLNGEITLAAGALGTTGVGTLLATGDTLQNTGANQFAPRWRLKLGGTTLIDTGAGSASFWGSSGGTRMGWQIAVTIANLTATSQVIYMAGRVAMSGNGGGGVTVPTGLGTYQSYSLQALIDISNNTTIDTTTARLLELTMQLPTSTANCECRLNHAIVTVV